MVYFMLEVELSPSADDSQVITLLCIPPVIEHCHIQQFLSLYSTFEHFYYCVCMKQMSGEIIYLQIYILNTCIIVILLASTMTESLLFIQDLKEDKESLSLSWSMVEVLSSLSS